MTRFNLHTPGTAPTPAGERLASIRKAWGFVPNLHAALAEAPTALEGYDRSSALAAKGTFTPAEQRVAFLTASRVNECEYCVSGRSALAAKTGLDTAAVEALRAGLPLADARLEALRRSVEAVVRERGHAGDAALDAFLAAGFTRAQALGVVLTVAAKTIGNNHQPPDRHPARPLHGADRLGRALPPRGAGGGRSLNRRRRP